MVEGQPARPANIDQIVAINQGRLPLTMEDPAPPALTPQEAEERLAADPGRRVIDMREPGAFGAGHIPGAINVQLSSSEFEQRIGWVLGPETPIFLVGESDADASRALHKMAFVGLDLQVEGFIAGGMGAWIGEGLSCDTLPQVTVRQLRERLGGTKENGWRVVDVREDGEWAEGHIEGARHMNFKSMGDRAVEFPFPREESLALVCATGLRSSTGTSLLRRHGFRNVRNVTGGMTAWRAAGYGVVSPS
ncbi:MAG: rhodanese-like domain-containing protein [bacterium]